MLALSLWQPYAWAMTHGKPVENRNWRPPDSALGKQIAIHAAKEKRYVQQTIVALEYKMKTVIPFNELHYGAVVAVATLVGWVEEIRGNPYPHMKKITGAGDILTEVRQSVHTQGPVCWVYHDAIELSEPVPCVGRQRLFTLPPAVAERVLAQLR